MKLFVRRKGDIELLRQMIDKPKSCIMTRKHILLTGITKTDNKLYGHKNILLKCDK